MYCAAGPLAVLVWLNASLVEFVTELLVLMSDLMLMVGPTMMLVHALMVAILCLGLSGISVGLGARLPNLREEDPSIGYGRDEQTHELLLSGQGQLHIEVDGLERERVDRDPAAHRQG